MILIGLMLLTGCASRPGPELLQPAAGQVPSGARVKTIYVATTRALDAADGGAYLGTRSETLNFAEFTISIPPGHRPGNIEWPSGKPDPRRDFVTLSRRTLTPAEFKAKVSPLRTRETAGIFVHGFNVNFQEALYQTAQMSFDADMQGVPLLFSWPSAGKVTGYVADKDAVTASRDGLAETLTILAKNRGVGAVHVLAHSMGGWLTAETLRQLKLTGREAVLDRLDVMMADPDLDADVFRSQLEVIGRFRTPLKVLAAPDDRALALSSLLAGDRARLGALNVKDPGLDAVARQHNVIMIDVSVIKPTDSFHHDRFSILAARIGRSARSGPAVQKAGAFVLGSVGALLASPFTIASQVVGE